MNSTKLPEWLSEIIESYKNTEIFQDPKSLQSHIDNSRRDMYQTLADFYNSLRHILYFAIAIIGASGAIIGYAIKSNSPNLGTFLIVASILMLATVPLGIFAILNMRERFRCYVSAVVYSYQVHMAAGLEFHPWLDWITIYLQRKNISNVQDITEYWMNTPPSTYIYLKRSMLLFLFIIFALSAILIVYSIGYL